MDYAIVGGGALGLGAAYRVANAGQPVMVFEQETTAGGLAAGFRVGDAWLEKFYHHLFRTDTTAIKLIRELGLGDRLEWSHPRTVCLIDGKFQQLDSPLTFLKFYPLRTDARLPVAAVTRSLMGVGRFKPARGHGRLTASSLPWQLASPVASYPRCPAITARVMIGGRPMARSVSYFLWTASSPIAIGSTPVTLAILSPAWLNIPTSARPLSMAGGPPSLSTHLSRP